MMDFSYLTGASNDTLRNLAENELYGRLGLLVTPNTFHLRNHVPSYASWGFDNACFSDGENFDGDNFLRKLEEIIETVPNAEECCRFAVAPDVFDPVKMLGDPRATIERSLPYFAWIREIGAPAAMVYQDGLEYMADEEIPWDEFDVAFIGGSDMFKLGYYSKKPAGVCHYALGACGSISSHTYAWADLIKRTLERGKEIHVGRVNSWARICFTIEMGAVTCDGTYATRGPKCVANLEKWLAKLDYKSEWPARGSSAGLAA